MKILKDYWEIFLLLAFISVYVADRKAVSDEQKEAAAQETRRILF